MSSARPPPVSMKQLACPSKEAASGSLYPMLARLEQAGWLTKGKENIDPHAEGRPPRLHYTISGAAVTAARRTQRPVPAARTRPHGSPA